MKIQRLFLRNVRNIKSLDLDFRDPVTGRPMSRIVLAGANGSGKTSILESLFGLMALTAKYAKGETDRTSGLEDATIMLSRESGLQLIFDANLGKSTPTTLSVYYGVEGSEIVHDPSVSDDAKAILGGRRGIWIGGEKSPAEGSAFELVARSINSAQEKAESAVGSIVYFPHNRHLPSVTQGELGFEIVTYSWAYRYIASDEWKGSTESYLFSLIYLDLEDFRNRGQRSNRFGQAVELVNSILDGKRIARIEQGRAIIETDKEETHGLGDLSSGEKQITLLLVEILRRIVPGSIILIDEPEISLHPAWQRGLVVALDKIIEQYDAQVIMATHSPEIASMVLPHEVLFLSDLNAPLGEWKPEQEAIA